jgi:hypothetical protein
VRKRKFTITQCCCFLTHSRKCSAAPILYREFMNSFLNIFLFLELGPCIRGRSPLASAGIGTALTFLVCSQFSICAMLQNSCVHTRERIGVLLFPMPIWPKNIFTNLGTYGKDLSSTAEVTCNSFVISIGVNDLFIRKGKCKTRNSKRKHRFV